MWLLFPPLKKCDNENENSIRHLRNGKGTWAKMRPATGFFSFDLLKFSVIR